MGSLEHMLAAGVALTHDRQGGGRESVSLGLYTESAMRGGRGRI